eukprot:RCo039879
MALQVCLTLLHARADPNARNNLGRTPAMLAAEQGLAEVVQKLAERGADLNAQNSDGETTLMYGAIYRHPEICLILLENRADPNIVDDEGRTALMLAAEKFLPEVCDYLLQARAEPNSRDRFGETPLMIAAQNGLTDVCQQLKDLGADVSVTDCRGRTAARHAALKNHSELALLLGEAPEPEPWIASFRSVSSLGQSTSLPLPAMPRSPTQSFSRRSPSMAGGKRRLPSGRRSRKSEEEIAPPSWMAPIPNIRQLT